MKKDARDLRDRPHLVHDEGADFNYAAHRRSHMGEIKVMTYTSKATLDTNASTPIYPIVPGRIISVRLNVAGAPSSTLTCDILKDGASIYTVSSKPTIASSALYGDPAVPDVRDFTTSTKLQVQLTATGSATGPLVVQIKCFVAIETQMGTAS